MPRRLPIVVVAILLIGAGAAAQSYIYMSYWQQTTVNEVPNPCGTGNVKAAHMTAPAERAGQVTAWLFAECWDGRLLSQEMALRTAPEPVYNNATRMDGCAGYPGFVPGTRGGCVPANHPDAR